MSHESEVVNFCKRRKRHLSRYWTIIIILWFLLLLVINIGLHINDVIASVKPKVVQSGNVFEKWYQANRRSLLEEDEDGNGLQAGMYEANNTVKNFNRIQQILHSGGTLSPDIQKKVFSVLDSFVFKPNPNVPQLDCQAVLRAEEEEIIHGKLANLELHSKAFEDKKAELIPSDDKVMAKARNCEKFKKDRQYISIPLSEEEKAYPIAYIITIHRDLQSFERLLRSIYHPQNIYCIHVDPKSPEAFQSAVSTVTGCFDNVFISSKLTSVAYSHWSRVEADLNCMEDLVKRKNESPWKYVINLCGQDFPLKTNLEMVRNLKNLQGFNNLETVKTPAHKKKRYEYQFVLPKSPKNDHALMKKTEVKKEPPPNNVEMFAGGAYYIFKRQAVKYMLTDPTVQQFFKWNEDTYSPDEHMWATLQRMYPQFPGSVPPHEKYDMNELHTITRIIKWGGLDKKVYPKCEGRFVRGVCVYGCGDLAWLVSQHHLFANKFDAEIDVLALECLDNWVRNRTVEQSKRYFARGYL